MDFIARVKPQKILANIFILQAWIPSYAQSFNYASWSMTVEVFFYVIFPFFILWAYHQSTRKLIWFSMVLWAFSQVVYHILWIGYYPQYNYFIVYFPFFHLNSFVMGVVGGIWFLREGQQQNIKPYTNLLVLAGAILFTIVYILLSSKFPQFPHGIQAMAGLMAPILILIIITLAIDKTRFSKFLNRPILVNLGETAYALYILHVPVIWIYERALMNSRLPDPQLVSDYTVFPLMIGVGLVAHFYIDQPIRSWLKKVMRNISMPLLIFDLVIFAVSTYISFRFRFGHGKQFLLYQTTALLVFWSAFIIRTILSAIFNSLNPSILYGPFMQVVRPILISVTIGSAVIAGIVYIGYSLAWFENFPRSIFLMDWILVFGLSMTVRFLFRYFKIYEKNPAPA
jgi:hypothetical protein